MVAPIFGIHDATTGFHDVKPLPTFAPIDWWLIAAVAAVGALFLWAILYRRRQKLNPAPPTIPPHLEAERHLQALKQRAIANSVALRELSTEASVIIRTYFERKLTFPATDETTNEVLRQLKQRLDVSRGNKQSNELLLRTTESLHFLDYLTFSDDSEKRFSAADSEVLTQLDSLGSVVNTFEITLLTPPETP